MDNQSDEIVNIVFKNIQNKIIYKSITQFTKFLKDNHDIFKINHMFMKHVLNLSHREFFNFHVTEVNIFYHGTYFIVDFVRNYYNKINWKYFSEFWYLFMKLNIQIIYLNIELLKVNIRNQRIINIS